MSQPAPFELKDLKIALWLDEPSFTIDPEAKAVIVRFAERLAQKGAVVESIRSPAPTAAMMFAFTTLLLAVIGFEMPWLQRAFYELLRGPAKIARAFGAGPFSWAHGALGVTARHREWLEANETRAKFALSVREFFTWFDVLIAPATPVVAFPHNHAPVLLRRLKCSDGRSVKYLEMLDWVGFATMFSLPATAVPAGLTRDGLPVGLQIVGPHGRDSLTLSLAQAIEEQISGFRPPPCVQAI